MQSTVFYALAFYYFHFIVSKNNSMETLRKKYEVKIEIKYYDMCDSVNIMATFQFFHCFA